jgi:hypothetical protein
MAWARSFFHGSGSSVAVYVPGRALRQTALDLAMQTGMEHEWSCCPLNREPEWSRSQDSSSRLLLTQSA